MSSDQMKNARVPHNDNQRVVVARVEDSPGVLDRISSMFRRRSFNIASLSVAQTHRPGISWLTAVVEAGERETQLLIANLEKLVCVYEVLDVTQENTTLRSFALVRVRFDPQQEAAVAMACQIFRARVLDQREDSKLIEVTGEPEQVQRFLTALSAFEVEEMAHCSAVAMQSDDADASAFMRRASVA